MQPEDKIDYNYAAGIAGLLTKYSFAPVRTADIQKFIAAIEERHGIKAIIKRDNKDGTYLLVDKYFKE